MGPRSWGCPWTAAAQFDLKLRLNSLGFFVFWSISDHPVASSRKLEVSVWVGLERQAPCPSHAGLGCQLWGPQDRRNA